MHDLVRDSIRQTLLATRPVASFPMGRSSQKLPAETDAAEVAEKLEEEAQLGQAAQNALVESSPSQIRTGTPWRAPTTPFKLSSPIPEPRTSRLPLEEALSPYAPAAPNWDADSASGPASPPAITAPGELPADLQPLGQVQESFIVAANPDRALDRRPARRARAGTV